MSTMPRLPAALLLLALGAAACSSGTASTPATSGALVTPVNPTVVPSPSIDGILHPTGADEVVLRFEEAGGFTPPEWQAARLPYFTLYGDGRVVFVQTTAEQPARQDNVSVGLPVRTGTLGEEQVQELLAFALADGGLAVAREIYDNPMVADAPSSLFTVNADNDSKTVSVMALGLESQPGPDTAVLKRLATLGERLRNFDQGGAIPSDPYEAAAYRGVILEQQGLTGVKLADWPWTDVEPADFKLPADASSLQQGTALLTPGQAAGSSALTWMIGILKPRARPLA